MGIAEERQSLEFGQRQITMEQLPPAGQEVSVSLVARTGHGARFLGHGKIRLQIDRSHSSVLIYIRSLYATRIYLIFQAHS